MSIVTMVLYNPVNPEGASVTVRMFLMCKTRRITIMSVRRMLSETEMEKYERP